MSEACSLEDNSVKSLHVLLLLLLLLQLLLYLSIWLCLCFLFIYLRKCSYIPVSQGYYSHFLNLCQMFLLVFRKYLNYDENVLIIHFYMSQYNTLYFQDSDRKKRHFCQQLKELCWPQEWGNILVEFCIQVWLYVYIHGSIGHTVCSGLLNASRGSSFRNLFLGPHMKCRAPCSITLSIHPSVHPSFLPSVRPPINNRAAK